jgi:hypothetical protein
VIRWKRANDGFVESHCGRWRITPQYGGLTRPECFQLWLDDKLVSGWNANQREAKEDAERIAERMEKK